MLTRSRIKLNLYWLHLNASYSTRLVPSLVAPLPNITFTDALLRYMRGAR